MERTLSTLMDNHRDWATERMRAGLLVPVTLLGIRKGAVTVSAVAPSSKLASGQVDEPALAAVALLRNRGAEEVVLALDSGRPEFGVTQRSLLVLTEGGVGRVTPVLRGGEEPELGPSAHHAWNARGLASLFGVAFDADAVGRCERAGVLVLDLEERFVP